MKKTFIFIAAMVSCLILAAQEPQRPDTYNYNRGLELLSESDFDEALQYFRKELKDNPRNGYAYSWIGTIYHYNEDYGTALTAYNKAISLLPSKDKSFLSSTYSSRAKLYLTIEDTVSALKDYAKAISICDDDDDLKDIYSARGDVYYQQGKYDLADRDYLKVVDLDEGGVMGRMGLARNRIAQKEYLEAIAYLNHVLRMHSDYSSGYAFRAEAYAKLHRYNEAIDDIIMALDIDNSDKAYIWMLIVSDSAFSPMVTKLKVKSLKEPNNNAWDYYLGVVYEHAKKYTDAITYYQKCENRDPHATFPYRKAKCFSKMGDYDNAIKCYTDAMQLDSSDYENQYYRSHAEYCAGRFDEALEDINALIDKYPDGGRLYYQRAWIKDHGTNAIDEAIEDYTMTITFIPQYAYAYMNRGVLYNLKGERQKARQDFEEALRLDTVERPYTCAPFAYLYLGNKEKAIETLDSMLADDREENLYDAACIYSIMGEREKSVDYLREALESGYHNIGHMQRDRDLDNIREMPQYKALVSQYGTSATIATNAIQPQGKIVTTEIPFVRENGVSKVKCSINGLPLHMIFDTGAGDVTISSVEAAFMFKNGYLSGKDVMGRTSYMTASGDIIEGTVINLNSIEFGGLKLSNVRASVVKGQNAPLLLGQSALGRLGKIEIDNNNRVLRISHIE